MEEKNDKRYLVIRERLSSLSNEEIQRIINNIDHICFDRVNYDEESNKYCPLAVAMNLHKTIVDPTDTKIKDEIGKRFNPVNIIKGIEGYFYNTERRDDLLKVCEEILNERTCIK